MVCMFNLASKCMARGTKLTKFTAFVMFFIKMRLGLQDEDIAFRFGCHISSFQELSLCTGHFVYVHR